MKLRPPDKPHRVRSAPQPSRAGEQLDLLGYTAPKVPTSPPGDASGDELSPNAAGPSRAQLEADEAERKRQRKALTRAYSAERRATGLQPQELCQPRSYMVEADSARALPRLVGMCDRHAGELAQWYALEGVTPTLGAIMALMRPLHGVPGPKLAKGDRRRLYGLGFQVPLRWLERYTGRHRATVCRALSLGVELGFIARFSNTRRVSKVTERREVPLASVVTRDGVERSHVNVHGVLYLTPKGAAWLDRRGFTSADLGDRNARLEGRRGHVRTGLLWAVQCALRRVARWVARRFSEGRSDATPEEEAPSIEESSVVRRAVENATGPPGEAVSASPTVLLTGPGEPNAPAKAPRNASAPPTGVPARTTRTGDFYPPGLTNAGAAGGGALPSAARGARASGVGPPTHWGDYLNAETDRCWTRHVQVEGGPARRVRVPVFDVTGRFSGDTREELRPGRVWTWSPALTAAEAYPVEWGQAGGGHAGDVIRATLIERFGTLLGRRLRLRFEDWESRRRAGLVSGCPLDGCQCLAAELGRAPPAAKASNATSSASLAGQDELEQVLRAARAVHSWALTASESSAFWDRIREAPLANRVDAVGAVAAAIVEACRSAQNDLARGVLALLEVLDAARVAGESLREDAAEVRWRRANAKGGAPAVLLEALRDAENMGSALAAWSAAAAVALQRTAAAVPRTAEEARKAWGPKLGARAAERSGRQ